MPEGAWRRAQASPSQTEATLSGPRASALCASLVAACALPRCAAASSTHPAETLTGFLRKPTDQIAVPGMRASAEITPEGDLYTGWAEYELRFGRRLTRWDQPTRTLPDPSQPLLSSVLEDGSVRYRLTVFAAPVTGMPIAYETLTATNTSGVPRLARASMSVSYSLGSKLYGPHSLRTGEFRYERPAGSDVVGAYEQPGQSFSSAFNYEVKGRDLLRSGLLLARGPATPGTFVPTQQGGGWSAPHDERLFEMRLRPHAHRRLTWQIPLEPPISSKAADDELDATPRAAALAELKRMWRTREAHMTNIEVPERKVVATYEASIAEMLLSRYRTSAGWMQTPNRLQYDSFWIRDASIESEALDLAGLHATAAQDLAFLGSFQQPSGLFISQAGQYDGLGEALWAIGRHAQLTGSVDYAAAQLPAITSAIGWLQRTSSEDPLGLLPAAAPHDDERVSGHLTGDDLWAAAGLRAAIADAKLAGRADLASAWQSLDERFTSSLRAAISAAVARAGHIPPALDSTRGQDWGNYSASYPVEVLGARSRPVQATLTWARSHMAEGLPTYLNGRMLHDYLGFRIFQTELAAGETRKAVAGLYSELAHTTSTDEGWETDVRPFGSRVPSSNLAPHGTFAAEYVALLRDMLISESPDGSVALLAGASPAWLAEGMTISVRNAPVDGGDISFSEQSSRIGETLRWKSSLPAGTKMHWVLPRWASGARTPRGSAVGHDVALKGGSGSITVLFSGRRPRQSYKRAVHALDAAYRAHGRAAPIVLSPRSTKAKRTGS